MLTMLLTACSADSTDSPNSPQMEERAEISLNANVSRVMEGTRATTFDNATDLQGQDVKVFAFFHDTETSYLDANGETLHYDSSEPAGWKFWNTGSNSQLHYYWPVEGAATSSFSEDPITVSSLDFFGYMPATYVSGLSYTAAHNVTFTCSNLPMTNAGQENLKEFMFGMALNQNYDNASSGVSLTFQHPFARIKLVLSSEQADVTIHTIKFKNIKNNGDYDLRCRYRPGADAECRL